MKVKFIVPAALAAFALIAGPVMADKQAADACKKEAAAKKVSEKDMGAFMKKCEADKKAGKKADAPAGK